MSIKFSFIDEQYAQILLNTISDEFASYVAEVFIDNIEELYIHAPYSDPRENREVIFLNNSGFDKVSKELKKCCIKSVSGVLFTLCRSNDDENKRKRTLQLLTFSEYTAFVTMECIQLAEINLHKKRKTLKGEDQDRPIVFKRLMDQINGMIKNIAYLNLSNIYEDEKSAKLGVLQIQKIIRDHLDWCIREVSYAIMADRGNEINKQVKAIDNSFEKQFIKYDGETAREFIAEAKLEDLQYNVEILLDATPKIFWLVNQIMRSGKCIEIFGSSIEPFGDIDFTNYTIYPPKFADNMIKVRSIIKHKLIEHKNFSDPESPRA